MLENVIRLCGGLSDILPNKNEKILIKPNFGCHKTAMTGATTDLRVLASLIEFLQSENYSDIVIGDGGMAGYLKIDILKYLGVPDLCDMYGVPVIDLNKDNGVPIKIANGATVEISQTALKSNLINLAKLKTHVLTTVSLGIKNLMGCVVGIDKREVHLHGLNKGLASLSSIINPSFTIIEGLVGMEGRGPVAGKAIVSDVIVASKDVLAADIIASKIMDIDPYNIEHIRWAAEMSSEPHDDNRIRTLGTSLNQARLLFQKPVPRGLEANKYLNRLKHEIRGTPFQQYAYALLSSSWISALIRKIGILQEEIEHDIGELPPIIHEDKCIGCTFCGNACPTKAISYTNKKANIESELCIKCYCCVEICSYGAIYLQPPK
jgi:uncharacterized protein (DUF362 family)/NAD-dependent dihydropyrimidine dehydrogenase PreA subunit